MIECLRRDMPLLFEPSHNPARLENRGLSHSPPLMTGKG